MRIHRSMKFIPRKIRISPFRLQFAKLSSSTLKRFDRPPENRIFRQKGSSKGFAIAVPQLLAGKTSRQRPAQRPLHDRREVVVEPNHYRCARPHHITHCTIVATHNSMLTGCGFHSEPPKFGFLFGFPVGIPIKSIQLHMRQFCRRSQRTCERRLARTTCSDDEDSHRRFVLAGQRAVVVAWIDS